MDSLTDHCWNCNSDATDLCPGCEIAKYCSEKCRKQDVFRHKIECDFISPWSTCFGCGQRKKTRRCKRCHFQRFCSSSCQKLHWNTQQMLCDLMFNTAAMVSSTLTSIVNIDMPWYWGNSIAIDYLKLFQNEGNTCQIPCLRLLFAACGDLRNVVKTVADLPSSFKGKIEFYLNDYSAHVTARNVLFLYLAFTIEDIHLCSSVTVQVWYSLLLSKQHYEILTKTLDKLVHSNSEQLQEETHGLLIIKKEHLVKIQKVWKSWLYQNTFDRHEMQKHWLLRASDSSMRKELECYFAGVSKYHKRYLKKWSLSGLLLKNDQELRNKAECPNICLLCFNPRNPISREYPELSCVPIDRRDWGIYIDSKDILTLFWEGHTKPFAGWDYVDVVKSQIFCDDIVGMYQEYIENNIKKFMSNISSRNVSFLIFIEDIVDLPKNFPNVLRFDRIATSNLADYIRSPNLLCIFGPWLNRENKHSVLVTEYRNWVTVNPPNPLVNPYHKMAIENSVLYSIGDLIMRPRQQNQVGNISWFLSYDQSTKEYFDNFFNFLEFLKAERIFESSDKNNLSETMVSKKIKRQQNVISRSLHVIKKGQGDVHECHGLRMREFWKELNRVVPFRWKVNARRVSNVIGNERCLEWMPR